MKPIVQGGANAFFCPTLRAESEAMKPGVPTRLLPPGPTLRAESEAMKLDLGAPIGRIVVRRLEPNQRR